MLASQQFCVKWNSYTTNLQNVFPRLLSSEHFVDLTLACEGRMIKCHKVVLSACSTYFEKLLVHNPCQHPIIFMKDMKHWEVQALVDFMYKGEVNVSQDELNSLLEAAEALQIRGLCGSDQSTSTAAAVPRSNPPQDSGSVSTATPSDRDSPPAKRPRRSADEDDSGGAAPAVDGGLTEKERSSSDGAAVEKKDIKQEPDTDDNFAETEVEDERQDDHYANHEPQDDSDSKDPPPSPLDLPGPSGQSISSHHTVNSEKPSTDLSSALALQNVMCVLKTQQQTQMQQSMQQFAAILPAPSGNSSLSNSADSKDMSHISPALQHSTPTVRVRRSEEELQKAAECVQKGMTFQNVSDIFNIPISTIRFYMARRGILPQRRRGRVSNSGASPVASAHAQPPSYMLLHYKLPDMGQGQQQLAAPGQVHLQQQQPQQQQQQQTSATVTVPTTASSAWKSSDN